MSAPKAQTSRFEREIRRERESGMMMMMSRRSLLLHTTRKKKKRAMIQKSAVSKEKEDEEKRDRFLTDIYYVVCVRIKEWGKSALDV